LLPTPSGVQFPRSFEQGHPDRGNKRSDVQTGLSVTSGHSGIVLMNTQLFARIYGIVFLIVGIGGFIPGLTQPHEHPGLIINGSSGMELGLFPVNVLHNAVRILL
jgi:hypothetical protein